MVLVALLVPVWAGEANDVWKGKHRVDIVALLGEPGKTKISSDGSTVLVYKLIRVGEGAVPDPSFRVFELPGVGLVGRVVKNEDPAVSETTTIEPSGLDVQGRPTAGGVARSPQTGERTGFGPFRKGPRSRGKVKLEFTLDAGEIVRGWSVSPK